MHSEAQKYSEITFLDRNPIKRFLQRNRLTYAIKMSRRAHSPRVILDFGAGNGELCKLLRSSYPHSRLLCYEPTPALMQEAKQNLRRTQGIEFLSQLDAVEPCSVDIMFCLEVFEHLPMEETADALRAIARMLSEDGHLVVGVPIETSLPALYKGVFRMSRRYGAFDATPKNVLACVVGKPPLARPKHEIADGLYYHPHHVGFDHRRFRSTLSASFDIEVASAAPIPMLGTHINPEVYFLAKKWGRLPSSRNLDPSDVALG
jgi:SAM-dependent methyltransferase